MISEETEIFTLFPFRRPPNLPFPALVHHDFGDPRTDKFRKIHRRSRGALDFARDERDITRPMRAHVYRQTGRINKRAGISSKDPLFLRG